MIIHETYLIYRYKGIISHLSIPDFDFFQVCYADVNSLERFFYHDKNRLKIFLKFQKKGFIGLLLHSQAEWISYTWMTTPYSDTPSHLPPWIQSLNAYWIFYSHTKENYRRQGLFKLSLKLLLNQVHEIEKNKQPSVYIDTKVQNIPSRRGISSVGFDESGIMVCYYFRIPKLKKILWCKWNKNQQHPVLPNRKFK